MTIDIDLDVYQALEARRTSFKQTHNAILRDILLSGGVDGAPRFGSNPASQRHALPSAGADDASREGIVGRTIDPAGQGASRSPGNAMATTQILEPRSGGSQRRTGRYVFEVGGKRYVAASVKHLYLEALRKLVQASLSADFLERLAAEETRGRRIVARRPESLYKRTPRLARRHAIQLDDEWWVDVNLSRDQVAARIRIACRVAGLSFGQDVKLLLNNQ